MGGIVDIQLKGLQKRLEEKQIWLVLDDKAEQWLAENDYDGVYGARPLKRVIQRSLQNPLAEKLLAGTIKHGDTIEVTASDLGLYFKPVERAAA